MPDPRETELNDVQNVLRAACFAAEKHAAQKRKGTATEPYVNHVLEVAGLVSTALAQADTNPVMAALLHDTIEDSRGDPQDSEARQRTCKGIRLAARGVKRQCRRPCERVGTHEIYFQASRDTTAPSWQPQTQLDPTPNTQQPTDGA